MHLKTFQGLRLRRGPNEWGSLVTNDASQISPCFPEARTEIAEFTITDSLTLRPRKLVYCKQQPLKAMLAIWMVNHPPHPLSYPQPITDTFIPRKYRNKTRPHHNLMCTTFDHTLFLKANFDSVNIQRSLDFLSSER